MSIPNLQSWWPTVVHASAICRMSSSFRGRNTMTSSNLSEEISWSAGPVVEGIKKWNFRDMPLMKNAENHRNWTFIGFIIKYSIRISNGQPANPKYHRNSYWFYRDQILSANNIGGQEHLQDVASVPNLLRNSGLKKLFISWIGSTVGHGHRKQKTCGCWWKWQWNLSYEYNLLFLILPYTPAFVA